MARPVVSESTPTTLAALLLVRSLWQIPAWVSLVAALSLEINLVACPVAGLEPDQLLGDSDLAVAKVQSCPPEADQLAPAHP